VYVWTLNDLPDVQLNAAIDYFFQVPVMVRFVLREKRMPGGKYRCRTTIPAWTPRLQHIPGGASHLQLTLLLSSKPYRSAAARHTTQYKPLPELKALRRAFATCFLASNHQLARVVDDVGA
jgi:hypothetical protein